MIDKLINPTIKDIKPYLVSENSACSISLDKNENPYNIMKLLENEIYSETNKMILNRYPDGNCLLLKEELSNYTGVNAENIIIGNGSDELIYIIMQAFLEKGQKVLLHSPTFSMYKNYALIVGGIVENYEMDNCLSIEVEAFKKAIVEKNPKILVICNPNNPTGGSLKIEAIEYLIKDFEGIVVIDEAYFEFFNQTAVELLNKYKNIIILRTFSKALGLAGLRLGYMLSNKEIIDYMERVKSPFNVNSYSQGVGIAVLRNIHKVKEIINQIIQERDLLSNKLADINGIEVFETSANFVLIRTNKHQEIYVNLLNKGISVKCFNEEKLKDCLRITVGTTYENQEVLQAIKAVCSDG